MVVVLEITEAEDVEEDKIISVLTFTRLIKVLM